MPPSIKGVNLGSPVNWGHPVNRGLVGWYLAGLIPGGQTWVNLVEASSYGTLVNGASFTGNSRAYSRGSVALDGSNDYVNLGDTLPENQIPITISGWVYLRAAGTYPALVCKSPSFNVGSAHFCVYLDGSSRVLSGIIGGGDTIGSAALTVPLSTWTFFAFTSSTAERSLQMNGVRETFSAAGFQYGGSTDIWSIGSWSTSGGNVNALMDDVRVYNRGLTSSEVSVLYQQGRTGNKQLLSVSGMPFPFYPAGAAAAFKPYWAINSTQVCMELP